MTLICLLAFAFVAYGAIVVATTLLSQPARIRVLNICEDMLAESRWNDDERAELNWMIVSSASSSIGLLVPVATLFALSRALLGAPRRAARERSRIYRDHRYDDMAANYMISIMGCSPFAALVAMPLLAATVAVWALRGDRQLTRIAESPVMEASASLRTC